MQTTYCPYCMKPVWEDVCPYCGSDVHYSGNPMHLPVGATLMGEHPYVLGACRGQGGFGVTYIALDIATNSRVAIKEYFPTYCSGRTVGATIQCYYGQEDAYTKGKDRFLDEAQMLHSLSDLSSVVNVLDFFELNNTAYLVMEFVDGCSLKDYVLKNGAMPAAQLLEQMRPLMQDMEAMHQRGVIHRDIAPDNIILRPDGSLTLIDFGAARSYLSEKSMSVVVKKGFAPVEQYLRTGLNASTDVYALAATIYYCITGTVPMDAAERLYGNVRLQSPALLGAAITAVQEEALGRALEIQPSNRTKSVYEFMQELFRVTEAPVPEEVIPEEPVFEEPVQVNAIFKKPEEIVRVTVPESEFHHTQTEPKPDAAADTYVPERPEPETGTRTEQTTGTKQTNKKRIWQLAGIAAAIAVLSLLLINSNMFRYHSACNRLEKGSYYSAMTAFEELGNYKDSRELYREARYNYGLQQFNAGEYGTATRVFESLGSYKDSQDQYTNVRLQYGVSLMREGKYDSAAAVFNEIDGTESVYKRIVQEWYIYGCELYEQGDYGEAITVLNRAQSDSESVFLYTQIDSKRNQAMYGYVLNHKDSDGRTSEKLYQYLSHLKEIDYADSQDIFHELYFWEATIVDFTTIRDLSSQDQITQEENGLITELKAGRHDYLVFDFELSGGPPDGSVTLYHVVTWPDGSLYTAEWVWEDVVDGDVFGAHWEDGVSVWTKGDLTVRIYIKETDECIGEYTLKVV